MPHVLHDLLRLLLQRQVELLEAEVGSDQRHVGDGIAHRAFDRARVLHVVDARLTEAVVTRQNLRVTKLLVAYNTRRDVFHVSCHAILIGKSKAMFFLT